RRHLGADAHRHRLARPVHRGGTPPRADAAAGTHRGPGDRPPVLRVPREPAAQRGERELSASRIAHAGLPFAHPMSETAVEAAIAALPLGPSPLILDTGCGNGEMLVRTLRRHAQARGLGVDIDRDAIAEARRRGAGLPVSFEVQDAATVRGRFDAVINVGSSHAHGGFPTALTALRALAPVA